MLRAKVVLGDLIAASILMCDATYSARAIV